MKTRRVKRLRGGDPLTTLFAVSLGLGAALLLGTAAKYQLHTRSAHKKREALYANQT